MIEEKEKRTFKLETARISSPRLVTARNDRRARRRQRPENAREIVIKLIEAIRKM